MKEASALNRLVDIVQRDAHKDLHMTITVKNGHTQVALRYKDKQIVPDYSRQTSLGDVNVLAQDVIDGLAGRAVEKPQPTER